MKKAIIGVLLLSLAAAAVFFVGYAPLRVAHDGVFLMHSKTGGWETVADNPTLLDWRWEFLLPTNAKIYEYPAAERTLRISVDTTLPSGETYASVLEDSPSFAVRIDMDVVVAVQPEYLVQLSEEGVRPETYDDWFDRLEAQIGNAAHTVVLEIASDPPVFSGATDPFAELVDRLATKLEQQFPGLSFVSFVPRRVDVPDVALYLLARDTYFALQETRRRSLEAAESGLALQNATQQNRMELFNQYGEILERYPVLLDYLSVVAETGGDPLGLSELREMDLTGQ